MIQHVHTSTRLPANPTVSVVIPALDEAQSVGRTAERSGAPVFMTITTARRGAATRAIPFYSAQDIRRLLDA